MSSIELKCLGCGEVLERETNGVKYKYAEKDNTVTNMETKDRDICDKCGCKYLIFNYMYDPKRVRVL